MIPLAAKTTSVTAKQPPIQIPANTKLSFLSIIHQKSVLLFVNAFIIPLSEQVFVSKLLYCLFDDSR